SLADYLVDADSARHLERGAGREPRGSISPGVDGRSAMPQVQGVGRGTGIELDHDPADVVRVDDSLYDGVVVKGRGDTGVTRQEGQSGGVAVHDHVRGVA